LFNTQA
jgi:hypothetical protein